MRFVGPRGEYCLLESSLFSSWLPLSSSVTGCTLPLATSSTNWGCRLSWTSVVVAMAFEWSSSLESTRPSDRSSRYVLIDARRGFASSKSTCYLPSRRPCFSRLFHSGRLVPGWLMVEAVSEAFAVWWCHTLGRLLVVYPSMASTEMALFLLQKRIREKKKWQWMMQEENLRCAWSFISSC